VERIPYFCTGCPHNSSTGVPEGSRALAGIGCHYMAQWMDRNTATFTHMGGEGASWIGQQPFTTTPHVFVNLGDGTYNHSGLLAIRAAVAAGVNVTYKLLYNDAVAMTGGQQVDGHPSVAQITHQLHGEGVLRIVIVTDEPARYADRSGLAAGVTVHERHALDAVQRELREAPGVTVLVYEQTCGTEKRRRRKRGLLADPARRTFIHPLVCEGCGDCGEKSNCLSLEPIETEFGRKRQIDQSSCNKDYSCVKGFCPSFVTVTGGNLRKPKTTTPDASVEDFFKAMPEPVLHDLSKPEALLVTGIGGTGVVTIGAILAMAAHLDGKGCTTMDQTGLAQKGGAVTSHVRIAKTPADINTVRLSAGGATAILGCDMLVTADGDALSKIRSGETKVILNTHKAQTGEFTHKPDWKIPEGSIVDGIAELCGKENLFTFDATRIATALLGNSIATNMFVLGYAWQKGIVPIAQDAIMEAIRLNGASIEMNQRAFTWGRRAAFDLAKVEEIVAPPKDPKGTDRHRILSETVDEVIERRLISLKGYQSAAYAKKYKTLVDAARAVDEKLNGKADRLTEAVAKYYYKLMAYKDEYEVARLYTDGQFLNQVKQTFEGGIKLQLNLAPPIFAKKDPATGHLMKQEFGAWIITVMRVLKHFKFLRGTPLDIFGHSAERRLERQLIADYKKLIETLLPNVTAETYNTVVDIASIPEFIRGYGHVKEKNLAEARRKEAILLEKIHGPQLRAQKWAS